MFIKVTKNRSGQAYYHLVESYRDGGKSRHRTLLSLGRVEDQKLEQLAQALAKHTELLTAVDLAKSISIEKTFILGPLLLLERLFERLGVDVILKQFKKSHPKVELDLRAAVFSMVAARFIQPGSKLAVYDTILDQLYPEMVTSKLELQHLYRALDLLAEHKEEMERDLYWRDRDLFNVSVDVVLYDLTTLRFESTRTDLGELRQFGYSKERRSDCTQVVLGLLVDTEGIPLGFEVYPGNTFEGKTLSDIMKKMRTKFKVRRFIFVADRGLISAENISLLKEDQGEFIVGMKLGALHKQEPDLYDLKKFRQINEELSVYETTLAEDRCLVTWSKKRAERDRKTREDILEKIRKKLSSKRVNSKSFVSNTNYRKYVQGLDEGVKPALDESVIRREAENDGFFGVISNVKDLSSAEIVTQYKQLWKIEDAFGEVKGTLRTRPIFHWTDQRIVGHLTLCFLAYYCEAFVTAELRKKNIVLNSKSIEGAIIKERPLTVFQAMKELKEIRVIPVQVKSKTLWVRTDIQGNAAKLFTCLGIRIPPKVLSLKNVVAQTSTNAISV